jgi:hypothetical protein
MLPTNPIDPGLLMSLLTLGLASVLGLTVMLLVLGNMPGGADHATTLSDRRGAPRLLGTLARVALAFSGVVMLGAFNLLR